MRMRRCLHVQSHSLPETFANLFRLALYNKKSVNWWNYPNFKEKLDFKKIMHYSLRICLTFNLWNLWSFIWSINCKSIHEKVSDNFLKLKECLLILLLLRIALAPYWQSLVHLNCACVYYNTLLVTTTQDRENQNGRKYSRNVKWCER